MDSTKYLSLDLGTGPEPTSLVIVDAKAWSHVDTRKVVHKDWVSWEPVFRDPDGNLVEERPPADYQLRHAERFPPGTTYLSIAQRVLSLATGMRAPGESMKVVLDATGVGQATTELFRKGDVCPRLLTVTGGDEVVKDDSGSYKVPKKELISTAQVLLQGGRLKIARALPLGDLLLRELQAFRMRVPLGRGEEMAAWREGANDDLVLALASGLWLAEKEPDYPFTCAYGKSEWDDGYRGADDDWGIL